MKKGMSKTMLSAAMLAIVSTPLTAMADSGNIAINDIVPAPMASEIATYWTPERMASAVPMPTPVLDATLGTPSVKSMAQQADGVPTVYPGSLPNSAGAEGVPFAVDPGIGVSYGDYLTDYPGPFSRWLWFGRYTTYPTSTVGKLFFSLSGGNYVCSASVVATTATQKDVIATAGHCVSDGAGTVGSNWYFCPSYNAAGENPTQGCWSYVNGGVKTDWLSNGNSEADLACLTMANTGTVQADNVGDVTGELGIAYDFAPGQPIHAYGYPAENVGSYLPTGAQIHTAVGPEMYTYNWGASDDVKYMGNDMTGGCSGGPWLMGLQHKNGDYGDTDGSSATDPGGNVINGVNSHKIVIGGVTRTQEMGSPQFNSTASGALPDAESMFALCASQADAD